MSKTETQISCRTTWEFKNRLEAQAARERRSSRSKSQNLRLSRRLE